MSCTNRKAKTNLSVLKPSSTAEERPYSILRTVNSLKFMHVFVTGYMYIIHLYCLAVRVFIFRLKGLRFDPQPEIF